MKRINQGSSASLNEPTFESLKPLYGSKGGNPPYYDPNDLHVHIWKKGKLGIEDNPKIKTYAKGKLCIKDCVYCKVCHIIKDSFQSSVSNNKDTINDIIVEPLHIVNSEYLIIKPTEVKEPFEIKKVDKVESKLPEENAINQKLFHKKEGIFDDYVEIS